MSEISFSWTSDMTTRRTVYVEVAGDRFGYKFILYESQERPIVEHRFNVKGLLRAEGYADKLERAETFVGFALLRRHHRQTRMTQRHCRTCCC